jgi:hypothetical protein
MCLAAIRKAALFFGVDVDGLQQLLFSSTMSVCEQKYISVRRSCTIFA